MPAMKILISNDDGVYAKGINVLAEYLRVLGDVTVVAPDRNRSGASNSLTLSTCLRLKRIGPGVVSVEGTPTDCVHLAQTGLFKDQADMVVSGINEGANLGDDILYSGTVAAAIEGRFMGLPAIAVSLAGPESKHYETAAKVAQQLVTQLRVNPLPQGTILNVNVPDLPENELAGFEVTRLGGRHRSEPAIAGKDPRGHEIYWIGLAGAEQDAGPGTDFHAINCKRVSITPIQVNWTNYEVFDQLSKWVVNLRI